MNHLNGKRVLVGVTGGIAAYKSAELVRRLRDAGAEVRVVMTEAATRFIGELTLQALSGHPVRTKLLDPAGEAGMGHIELARWADAVLVAPAGADFLARLAHGRADDLLCALCLATEAPLAVAPAMNRVMWRNPATQENMASLAGRGIHCLGPAEGAQACGEVGAGRMLEPAELLERVGGLFATGSLAGRHVLVTAGPTREAIDPVRFISNRSSGKMGYAVAAAAAVAGARVTLVSGPVTLPCPSGVVRVTVESATDMQQAVMGGVGDCDIFVGAAAVADYRPSDVSDHKLKKTAATMQLELRRNPDILAQVAALPRAPFTVGFAAESERLAEYAEGKRRAKRLDMIAANWINRPGSGFDSDDNALLVLWEGGSQALAQGPKTRLARELMELVARRFAQASGNILAFSEHAKDSA
ncbi:MAG: bifunctional phosphopantothenoylcysteine decarboxylase/phosphopantothenate--cysteine ligase CoaBC [Gammaproteobacteria bacterium]